MEPTVSSSVRVGICLPLRTGDLVLAKTSSFGFDPSARFMFGFELDLVEFEFEFDEGFHGSLIQEGHRTYM